MNTIIPASAPDLALIRQQCDPELREVEVLLSRLDTSIPLTLDISQHTLGAGGKRIRPLVLLLWARHLGSVSTIHIQMGAALEMVHTATLLHDDVVDDSPIRRGQKTAKEIWGNAASVLVGDYLYAQAYQLFTESNSLPVLKAVARATHALAEGEVLQLTQRRNCHITLDEHLKILHCKTATLFELAGVLGAVHAPASQAAALAYGSHLGMAFQLIDDALDYAGETASLGKRVGDDLSDGNFTYPLLHALHHASPADKKTIQEAVTQGSTDALSELQAIIRATGSIEATQALAQQYASQALAAVKAEPATAELQALKDLAIFAITRHY